MLSSKSLASDDLFQPLVLQATPKEKKIMYMQSQKSTGKARAMVNNNMVAMISNSLKQNNGRPYLTFEAIIYNSKN